MRTRTLALMAFLLPALAGSAGAAELADAAGRYAISSAGSNLGFSIASMGGTGIAGRFTRFSGTIDIDRSDIGRSSVDITIIPASVRTGQDRVDAFLKSDAVFDVEREGAITFRSSKVHRTGDMTAAISGSLTARGRTRPAIFEAELAGRGTGWVSFRVRGKILRSPYGMDVGTPIYSNVVAFDMLLKARRR